MKKSAMGVHHNPFSVHKFKQGEEIREEAYVVNMQHIEILCIFEDRRRYLVVFQVDVGYAPDFYAANRFFAWQLLPGAGAPVKAEYLDLMAPSNKLLREFKDIFFNPADAWRGVVRHLQYFH